MKKKHLVTLASVLCGLKARIPFDAWQLVTAEIVEFCRAENTRFDERRFRQAIDDGGR